MTVEDSYSTFNPRSGSKMLVIESATPASPAAVVAPHTEVRSALTPVDGNTNYDISFYAAHVVKVGGANPQFTLRYYRNNLSFLGETGFESFSSIGSAWTRVERNFTTPAAAAWVTIEWIQAVGAGNDFHWVTLIDDVELPGGVIPGGQSVLTATAADGVEISWDTEIGFDYQVEAMEGLDEFLPFGSVIHGNGSSASVVDLLTSPAKFYRVKRLVAP